MVSLALGRFESDRDVLILAITCRGNSATKKVSCRRKRSSYSHSRFCPGGRCLWNGVAVRSGMRPPASTSTNWLLSPGTPPREQWRWPGVNHWNYNTDTATSAPVHTIGTSIPLDANRIFGNITSVSAIHILPAGWALLKLTGGVIKPQHCGRRPASTRPSRSR